MEEARPALSRLSFVDPQRDAGRPHVVVPASAPRPLEKPLIAPRSWPSGTAGEVAGAGRMWSVGEWVGATHTTSLLVLDGPLGSGTLVREWYDEDGAAGVRVGADSRLLGASMTKSVLAHLVGRAVGRGALALGDPVVTRVPELAGSGYDGCTVGHLLTMTTGTAWVEDHRDPDGPASRLVGCFAGAGGGSGGRSGGSSRELLRAVEAGEPPGTRWEYSTADSQVLDWVRERATGVPYADALAELWTDLGCVRDAVVAVDEDGAALAGGGLAACAEDWVRVVALQLDGSAYGKRVLDQRWLDLTSRPPQPWMAPGRLPSTITAHAGFGGHWWPVSEDGSRVVADGSRGQLGYVDRTLGVVVLKTSLFPYDDAWVDRQQRDLSYLGLPVVARAHVAR